MKVLFNADYNPKFQAKPNAAEMKAYTKSISEGLNVLNKKVGIIIHNSSVPAAPELNTGVGSLLSKNAEAAFIPFLREHAVSTIQQEPDSLRGGNPSPYSPVATSKNIFMIPVERLASSEYGHLLSEKSIKNITAGNNLVKVNYQKVEKDYDNVLKEAYNNFKRVSENPSAAANEEDKAVVKKLGQEFEEYKAKNTERLEPAAIYDALSRKNDGKYWKDWSKLDKNLYNNPSEARIDWTRKKYENDIDFYMFKQMLAEREISNANLRNEQMGIKVVGDSPIAFTPVEEWQNQDLFMDGWALGCPPDGYSPDGQRWGFSVLKPETIFNTDGTLGKGGELMRQRYESMFEASPGGARIDHIIGLIDPYVYSINEPVMNDDTAGRLYSSPNHPVLGKYAKKTDEEYAAILEKIVIPSAQKYGLSKEDIICEDLGTVTEPVQRVMKRLGLAGISVTEFDYRGKDANPEKVIMLGSHDNSSFVEYTDKLFNSNDKEHFVHKTRLLAEDTAARKNINKYHHKIMGNKFEFMKAAFAELFTSPAKKIQVFFTDFFGIGKTYNVPGTTDDCWTLRLEDNFEKLYYDNLSKGFGLNLPESIAQAIRQKGRDFAQKHQPLLEQLDHFTKILKQ